MAITTLPTTYFIRQEILTEAAYFSKPELLLEALDIAIKEAIEGDLTTHEGQKAAYDSALWKTLKTMQHELKELLKTDPARVSFLPEKYRAFMNRAINFYGDVLHDDLMVQKVATNAELFSAACKNKTPFYPQPWASAPWQTPYKPEPISTKSPGIYRHGDEEFKHGYIPNLKIGLANATA